MSKIGDKLQGRIVKGIAGFYYVKTDELGIVECHAKGKFRKEQRKPLVGDLAEIEIVEVIRSEEDNAKESHIGSIVSITERKNSLIRPEVANVDQALIIFAHTSPEPNLNLLDKFLIMMEKNDVPCILCFNKEDLKQKSEKDALCEIYKDCGARVYSLQANANDLSLTQRFENLLDKKLTVLAGPSGVGKSTLVNLLCPDAEMETGEISKKLERGKHTTRHSELFEISEDTFLMDTPGFTAFDLDEEFEKEDIRNYYPEFYPYEGKCKYQECSHTHEPKCAVKDAVEKNEINKIRYDGYVSIYEEIKNRRKY